jgi:hypothetical protein
MTRNRFVLFFFHYALLMIAGKPFVPAESSGDQVPKL